MSEYYGYSAYNRVGKLEKRLKNFEAIERILRANNMHDPECRTIDPTPAQKLYPLPCDCWLSETD